MSYNKDKVIEINVSTDPLKTVDISGTTATAAAAGAKKAAGGFFASRPKAAAVSADGGLDVEFSYSVKWKETNTPFEQRMNKYSRYSFLPQHLEVRGDYGSRST